MLQRKVAGAPRCPKPLWPYQSDSIFKVFGVFANRKDISYVMFRGLKVWLNEPQDMGYQQSPRKSYPYGQPICADSIVREDACLRLPQEYTPESSVDVTYDKYADWYSQKYQQ